MTPETIDIRDIDALNRRAAEILNLVVHEGRTAQFRVKGVWEDCDPAALLYILNHYTDVRIKP